MELGVLLPEGGRWGKGRGQDSAGQLPQAFSCPRTATSSFPPPPPPPPPPPLPPSGGLQLTDCHCVWRVDTGAGGAEEGGADKKVDKKCLVVLVRGGGWIGKRGGVGESFFGGIFENLEKGANLMCWYLGLQNITLICGNVYFIELVVLFMFV